MVRFSSITIMFLLFIASSNAAKIVNVHTICKKTQNPSFCSTFLKSRPRSVHGDLVSLAKYSIEDAHAKITNTINLITKLIARSRFNAEKSHYRRCSIVFTGILDEIKEAQGFIESGEYQGLYEDAESIREAAPDCLNKAYETPSFDENTLLPKYAHDVEKVADIILVISNILRH
ncbi:putative pectinesterase inhibitor domain-containing protein [Medicago truncatula]|uniref:Plant invertase/pectin methylesterase inhibitor n=1 Tax=Medicago truncatula TaxID=3880 RepID=A0A072U8N6_MEDTR|nr:plant invertase/pectin methylesterase inhibitor [Medicago truncatula]RHN50634.1 putative pectinesterase inhibitor domain-containing protein [Medicago truncatula]